MDLINKNKAFLTRYSKFLKGAQLNVKQKFKMKINLKDFGTSRIFRTFGKDIEYHQSWNEIIYWPISRNLI
jgi:hypothetical protein